MNSNTSYINREHSIWVKGILSILIVLGHDMVFTIPLQEYGVMSFLYMFHIQVFFILPFLYGIDNHSYTKERLKNTIIRFFWPYLLLVALFVVGYNIVTLFSHFSIRGLFRLYVFCDGITIRQMCGVQIFWFLPSMMCTVLLKELYYRSRAWIKCLLFVLSFIFIGFAIYSRVSYSTYDSWSHIMRNIPLGGGYAINMLALGVITRWFFSQMVLHKRYVQTAFVGTICFIVCSILYWHYVADFMSRKPFNVLYTILQQVAPVTFIAALVAYINLLGIKRRGYISEFGKYSLLIYLISPFVGYVCAFVAIKLHLMYWWMGLLIWPLIVLVSYRIAIWIGTTKFSNILIPQNADVLQSACKKVKEKYF